MSHLALTTGMRRQELEARLAALREILAMPGQQLDGTAVELAGSTVGLQLSNQGLRRDPAGFLALFEACTGAAVRLGGGSGEVTVPPAPPRSLWMARLDDGLVLSTSLRLVVFLLGSFEPDPAAETWMLTTGSLGPDRSWDRRIRQAGPRQVIDLGTGRVSRGTLDLDPSLRGRRFPELDRRLDGVLSSVFDRLSFPPDEWVLPISGGMDSRALGFRLGTQLQTFTVGAPRAGDDPRSDVAVATRVAEHFGWPHRLVEVGAETCAPETVIDRFVVASEGRVDHLGGYLDGMEQWETLNREGISGLVRGDSNFGWSKRPDHVTMRWLLGAAMPDEVVVPDPVASLIAERGDPFDVPSLFLSRPGESLDRYRDRVYNEFRLPAVIAALTEVKSSYLDVSTPLLHEDLIMFALAADDRWRRDRRLWSRYVLRRSDGIPLASHSAPPDRDGFLRLPATTDVLRQRLGEGLPSTSSLPGPLVERVLDALERPRATPVASRSIKLRRLVPEVVARELAIRRRPRPVIGWNLLAFRLVLVTGTHRVLSEVAARGAAQDSSGAS